LPAYRDSLEKLKNAQIIKLNPQEVEKMKRMWGGDPAEMVQKLLNYNDPNNQESSQQVRNWAQQTVLNWLKTQGWQLKEGQQLEARAARQQKPILDPKAMQQEGFQQALNAMGVKLVLQMMGADKFVHKKQLFLEQYESQKKQKQEQQNQAVIAAQELGKQNNFDAGQIQILAKWIGNNMSFFADMSKYPTLSQKISKLIAEKLRQNGLILPSHTHYESILQIQNKQQQRQVAAAINVNIASVAEFFVNILPVETLAQLVNNMLQAKGKQPLLKVTEEELAQVKQNKQTEKEEQQKEVERGATKKNQWAHAVHTTMQNFPILRNNVPAAAAFTVVLQKPESLKRFLEWRNDGDQIFNAWIRTKQINQPQPKVRPVQPPMKPTAQPATASVDNILKMLKFSATMEEYSVTPQSVQSLDPRLIAKMLEHTANMITLDKLLYLLGRPLKTEQRPYGGYAVHPATEVQSKRMPGPSNLVPGKPVEQTISPQQEVTTGIFSSNSNISTKYVKGVLEKLLK